MKTIKIFLLLLIALAMGIFTACSDTDSNNAHIYTINATENRDIPLDSEIVSISTQEAQIKLTRDVEANIVNVYVISGSVEVTEPTG